MRRPEKSDPVKSVQTFLSLHPNFHLCITFSLGSLGLTLPPDKYGSPQTQGYKCREKVRHRLSKSNALLLSTDYVQVMGLAPGIKDGPNTESPNHLWLPYKPPYKVWHTATTILLCSWFCGSRIQREHKGVVQTSGGQGPHACGISSGYPLDSSVQTTFSAWWSHGFLHEQLWIQRNREKEKANLSVLMKARS